MSYKPDGYPDVSAYLMVRDGGAALDFIQRCFDAEVKRKHLTDNGRIDHAEVVIGDSLVMLGEVKEPGAAHLHVYLADPERALNRGRAAGGVVIAEMERKPDGDMRGGIRAPDGTVWWVARSLAAGSAKG